MSQQAELDWRDGRVPVSTRFDDPYFSLENGLAESAHVFLSGNDLPNRLVDGFHVAELGFGTGLNFLALLRLWRGNGQTGRVHFTSFEAFPMAADDMLAAHAEFPEVADLSAEIAPFLTAGATEIHLKDADLTLILGDARETLPRWTDQADAWFLDGFSPAKNPEMWEPALLAEVAAHTAAGGSAATYTAAGHVRRALQEAGFIVERHPGFGRKRHMTAARMQAT